MPKQVAIFDMDGLFVDSECIYAEGWNRGFKEYGISIPEGFVESLTGQSSASNDKKIINLLKDPELAKKIRVVRENYYQEKLKNSEIKLRKFAKEFAEILKNKGFKLILASSSTKKRIDELLSKNNACDVFDAIICAEQVKKLKPEPDIYLAALDCFNTNSEEAIAFEDTIVGATAAVTAGIDVCLVSELLYRNQLKFEHVRCLGLFRNLEETYNFLEANQIC
ncbi:HAD family hydrolase [Granulicatella elegans]|uniref:HAD family hydrolase n=1 Tax=Granulicatella elegans TaxID=137732 RepID=UPI000A5160D7|nr:HAD family phosphatase [Granulicatella elegans]UEA31757.1 HAD family phosphatase [Granulicatella elegans]